MASRIITIAQQKGGSGKTTLAAHLAVAWLNQGQRVATVDIDPQGSLSQWAAARTASLGTGNRLTHRQITGWRTQKEVEQLARDHDRVVIDSPPHAETEARVAIRAAALVVVPLQPSPMDLWATQPTLTLARQEKVPLLLVLNRVPSRGRLADALMAQVQELAVPPAVQVAEVQLGNRISFAEAMLEGRTVTETARRTRAAEEIQALADTITALLG